jgi:protein involved in polysaccharide export with SLBB domain
VRLEGEVAVPGIYQVQPGETLRQLVMRAGGLSQQAYVYGAEFYRDSVRKDQQQKLDQVLDRMERSLAQAESERVASALSADDLAVKQGNAGFQRQMLAKLRGVKALGRIVLEVPPGEQGATFLPDLPLEDGDRLLVPHRPATVQVVGEVNNASAYIYKGSKAVDDYLDQAGGFTESANEDGIYVIRADGSVVARNGRGWFTAWFRNQEVQPGDTIVVPFRVEEKFNLTKEFKDWTQILYQFGLGAASLKVLKDL